MLILLISLAFLVLSFSSYALAYQIAGINRVVVGTPISIFESSILYDPNSTTPNVRINKDLANKKLSSYYDYELAKFSKDYSYEIYYYNPEDESMCIEDDCLALEITFTAELSYNYHYEKILNYSVEKSLT